MNRLLRRNAARRRSRRPGATAGAASRRGQRAVRAGPSAAIIPCRVSAPDTPPPVERDQPRTFAVLRRLIAARSALASGQIEDTRRLLQEAQLQFVFRPVGSPDDDPVPAGRAASDVAHALDALSGNDIALSRGYIDRAGSDDVSGRAADPRCVTSRLNAGYAPAYPLR